MFNTKDFLILHIGKETSHDLRIKIFHTKY
jgi:hypothetical protein